MKITSSNTLIRYPETSEPAIQYIPVSMTGQQSLMAFHRHLLHDSVRTQSFLDAVAAAVKDGDIVVDLGTGTGVLAMAAARAGARRVHAIEANEIIRGAKAVAQANGLESKIVFDHGEAARITLPEPVDVLVSECIGIMGPGDMMATVAECARKWLRPGGKTVPEAITLYLVPVESTLHWDYVSVWQRQQYYGLDFSPLQPLALNNVYVAWFDEASFLCAPQEIATRALMTDDVAHISNKLRFRAERQATVHGFAGWFDVDLGGGVRLSSAPSAAPTIWQQTFFPLEEPVAVGAGSVIEMDFSMHSRSSLGGRIPPHFAWNTSIAVDGESSDTRIECKQSTLKRVR
ncbi:Histone-arginine N-methyltransferase [Haliangium ochraceum DSM 14365]|uniref:Histone-arginine N-methyltransferase n=2 Tax=Haliangium ochraceum TaxID=80816 RepID=D0LP56_HALO1|nr:Histone-arginine N-methyltransferase [Haliangium ochraceum DSM 14365]